ncbi:hypothetical protein C8C76_1321 [Halanaerobium saccharolyticum]|jgi:hypothetical protein|uniref:Uncharacterized protein n=1 Tax=Halanaerobium saccharolyticum TaxID=43595 RepID=A0A2T5RGV6_9FIRM|nr:hypothetical protein [Halanaerobium saccharolyticum]PTV94427.1 hypothetical protein C8C76_1321 [Halanaerobium saccharolyticum]
MNLEEEIKNLNEELNNNVVGGHFIDPGMQPIIKQFIKKGIKTYSSCEGHFENDIPQILLSFEYNKYLIKKFMRLKEFDIRIDQTSFIKKHLSINYKRCTIYRLFYNSTEKEFYEIKERILKNILKIIDSYEGENI